MASKNQVVTLFSAQGSDATSSASLLTPDNKSKTRRYDILLRGDIGGGTFKLQMSLDGTNYVDVENSSQVALGIGKYIEVEKETYIKGVLSGSTSPSLTAELFYKFTI